MALPFAHRPATELEPQRKLGDDGDSSYFVNGNGNYYPAYSVAWRYLGLFVDCSASGGRRRRRLEDGNNGACQRKLLWAAYHDDAYSGNGIGEYSFYDPRSLGGRWDSRTCQKRWLGPFWAPRCQKLDCHEKGTLFELVGVFKETYGLADWSEQLFKHQGYCQWDGDKNEGSGSGSGDNSNDSNDGGQSSNDYEFMSNLQESWVQECTELDDHVDADTGAALYVDTKPQSGGDMTYGLYTDASCSAGSESTSVTWSDVLAGNSNNNNNGEEDQSGDQNNNDSGDDDAYMPAGSIERWNDLLGDYKVCQPCVAYNRVKTNEGNSRSGSGSNSNDEEEDEEDDDAAWGDDDGEGSDEPHGYNCDDAAGYRNCNQCYKFESQTDMERATTSDLQLATEQGTILSVQVDGVTYGSGYYTAPGHAKHVAVNSFLLTAALVGLGFVLVKEYRKHRRASAGTAQQKAGLTDDGDDHDNGTAPPRQDEAEAQGGSVAAKWWGSWSDWLYGVEPILPNTVTDPLQKCCAAPTFDASMYGNSYDASTFDEASTMAGDSYREELLEEIQERDAKLTEKEQHIQQLQQQLDSYRAIAVVEGVSPGALDQEGQSSPQQPTGEFT